MSFPSLINTQPAPGVVGQRCDLNPTATVDFGPGGAVAGVGGVTVGRFAWIAADGISLQNTMVAGVPTVPDGFVGNTQQGLITAFLAESTLLAPQGYGMELFQRGGFWARNTYQAATRSLKVFANLFSGSIVTAAAGSSIVDPIGTATSITASIATSVLTVTVTNGYIAPGQLLTSTQSNGVPQGTYIVSQATGSAGSTGTYNLSTTPGTVASRVIGITSEDGAGGFTGTASFDTSVMTVTVATAGTLKVGMPITSAGVAAGTYITSLGTGTGGTGTYNLSTTPGTITAQAVTATAWIETAWYANSAANVGELVKIGVRN